MTFLAVFFVFATMTGFLTHFLVWLNSVSACQSLPSNSHAFFSACGGGQYGEYEHGAYYYELETEAVSHAKQAEVLFLGSSRVQFGFSTQSTQHFFTERRIPYYLLGFGYADQSSFAELLMKRLELRPKVLVINVDPFFSPYSSPIAEALVHDRFATRLNYIYKWLLPRVRAPYCALPWNRCGGPARSIYRDPETGQWIWAHVFNVPESGHQLLKLGKDIPEKEHKIYMTMARNFFAGLEIPASCVILTSTPNDMMDVGELVREMAEANGAKAVLPQILDVIMLDEDHLNLPTAERWSEAFLRQIAPIVDRCAGKKL